MPLSTSHVPAGAGAVALITALVTMGAAGKAFDGVVNSNFLYDAQ
jgi:hypothetical protein